MQVEIVDLSRDSILLERDAASYRDIGDVIISGSDVLKFCNNKFFITIIHSPRSYDSDTLT